MTITKGKGMYGEPTPGETLGEAIDHLAAAREHHRAQRTQGGNPQSGDAAPADDTAPPTPTGTDR